MDANNLQSSLYHGNPKTQRNSDTEASRYVTKSRVWACQQHLSTILVPMFQEMGAEPLECDFDKNFADKKTSRHEFPVSLQYFTWILNSSHFTSTYITSNQKKTTTSLLKHIYIQSVQLLNSFPYSSILLNHKRKTSIFFLQNIHIQNRVDCLIPFSNKRLKCLIAQLNWSHLNKHNTIHRIE